MYSRGNCCQHIGPVLFKQKVTYSWPNDELPVPKKKKKKSEFSKHVVTSCLSVYLMGSPSPKALYKNQYDHIDLIRRWWGLFCSTGGIWVTSAKNISHPRLTFSKGPCSISDLQQWRTGGGAAGASVENYHLRNSGSLDRFPHGSLACLCLKPKAPYC